MTPDEAAFFCESDPTGFILFARNVESPTQVSRLVADLRGSVNRADAPVLIDQEGGRVARLTPPQWRAAPPAAFFGALAAQDKDLARTATRLNSLLLAADLRALGITVDCAPVLDLRHAGGHDIIGDRAFSDEADLVASLGRAACEGFIAGGVLPVIKHIPGHGRARVDSHESLPVVEVPFDELCRTDFVPFRALSDMPLAMTAHILYADIDADHPASTSSSLISEVIRRELGFGGLLLSDDIGMKALQGSFGDIARAVLDAGCDIVLHCSGELSEMTGVAAHAGGLTESAGRRLEHGLALIAIPPAIDIAEVAAQLKKITENQSV